MTLSQRLLVADAHRMIRDEGADRVEVGSSDVSGSGSDASSQTSRHSRRARRVIPFDQVDCRPTISHPGGIFEELSPLPPELLRATSSVDHGEAPAVEREGAAEDPVETNPSEGVPEDRPRKKKRSIEAEPRPSYVEAALVEVVTRDGVSPETPLEKRKVPEGGDLGDRPENENLEEVPGKDNLEIGNTPVREEETENVGIEDPVLVSDSSSEGREVGKEEDDRVKEASPSHPVEEDPTAAATEDPVGSSDLGMPEEIGQDSAP
ncbi:hypothetical protein HID58_042357 [Brassica napus]|uniref:Uncharacterized protein n=1 Tax=Brassica napus TaxID=3708 RepID=A0ABQ8BDG4_BRANA|nr:hypothetical protein HID58_042357 [Brassica napus]